MQVRKYKKCENNLTDKIDLWFRCCWHRLDYRIVSSRRANWDECRQWGGPPRRSDTTPETSMSTEGPSTPRAVGPPLSTDWSWLEEQHAPSVAAKRRHNGNVRSINYLDSGLLFNRRRNHDVVQMFSRAHKKPGESLPQSIAECQINS